MKRITIFAALFLSAPALAQAPAPTADQIREDANALISAVRSQRDDNADRLAQAIAQVGKMQKEIETLKAEKAKASDPKKDDAK